MNRFALSILRVRYKGPGVWCLVFFPLSVRMSSLEAPEKGHRQNGVTQQCTRSQGFQMSLVAVQNKTICRSL